MGDLLAGLAATLAAMVTAAVLSIPSRPVPQPILAALIAVAFFGTLSLIHY